MARTRKYLKGPPVREILEAVSEIMDGHYLFWNDKPQHPSWLGSMPLLTLAQSCRHGTICLAQINPAWTEPADETVEETT